MVKKTKIIWRLAKKPVKSKSTKFHYGETVLDYAVYTTRAQTKQKHSHFPSECTIFKELNNDCKKKKKLSKQ